jgi:hypothetical protein
MSDKQLEINDLPEDARALSGDEMKGVQGGLGIIGGSGGGLLEVGGLGGPLGAKTPSTVVEPCKHDPNKSCCY